MIYEILPDTVRSTFDFVKTKFGPHDDGNMGSMQNHPMDLLSNQMKQLSLQKNVANQTSSMDAPASQTSEVHAVQMKNPKGNQKPEDKKKRKDKKGLG
jgi:hypothetical protein